MSRTLPVPDAAQATRDAVLGPDGRSDASLREAIFEHALRLAADDESGAERVPAQLLGLVDKIVRHAYRVTDADIEDVVDAGYTEDAVFDVIVAAALGAAWFRRAQALQLVDQHFGRAVA